MGRVYAIAIEMLLAGEDSRVSDKRLDLSKTVYELCSEHPELVAALADLGFTDITKPGMLQSAGRFMTIPKGATLRRRDLDELRQDLAERGFETYWSTEQ